MRVAMGVGQQKDSQNSNATRLLQAVRLGMRRLRSQLSLHRRGQDGQAAARGRLRSFGKLLARRRIPAGARARTPCRVGRMHLSLLVQIYLCESSSALVDEAEASLDLLRLPRRGAAHRAEALPREGLHLLSHALVARCERRAPARKVVRLGEAACARRWRKAAGHTCARRAAWSRRRAGAARATARRRRG